jgi:hypothetical protein
VLRCLKLDSLGIGESRRTGSPGVEFVRGKVGVEVFRGGVRQGVEDIDDVELFRINLG